MLDSGLKYLPPGVSGFWLATAFSFAAGLALCGTGAATTDVTPMPSAIAEIANTLFMESPQKTPRGPSRAALLPPTLAEGMAAVTASGTRPRDFVGRSAPRDFTWLGSLRGGRLSRPVERLVAQHRRTVHDAPAGKIIVHRVMLRAAIVPEGHAAFFPAPAHRELWLLDVLVEEFEEQPALLAREPENPGRESEIDEQAVRARFGMG